MSQRGKYRDPLLVERDIILIKGPFHACTSVIPVVYFPVKVISTAKYSRDQSISLTTVPTKREGREAAREERKRRWVGGAGGLGGVASELQTKEQIRGGL